MGGRPGTSDRREDRGRCPVRLGQSPAHPGASASRMPGEHELAGIADRLGPALDLSYPDPETVRLAALAGQTAPAGKGKT
jgi:hypothetical protein